jgi:hypothetical protein
MSMAGLFRCDLQPSGYLTSRLNAKLLWRDPPITMPMEAVGPEIKVHNLTMDPGSSGSELAAGGRL